MRKRGRDMDKKRTYVRPWRHVQGQVAVDILLIGFGAGF
jgi:hypothetical protein